MDTVLENRVKSQLVDGLDTLQCPAVSLESEIPLISIMLKLHGKFTQHPFVFPATTITPSSVVICRRAVLGFLKKFRV